MALNTLDLTSNNNDLTNSGALEYTTDNPFSGANNSHSLDLESSSSQYASVSDSASLSITGDISIEGWIKLEQLPSTKGSIMTIVSKYNQSSSDREYIFYIENTGTYANKLSFNYSSDGTNITKLRANVAFDANDVGKWIHVAIAVDVSAGSCAFYHNGIDVGYTKESGTQTSIKDGASSFAIGANDVDGTPSIFFDGLIDDLRVWSDIRTATEIRDNFSRELVGTETNLVGYWKLNNNYNDSTANGNNLTASGSPVFSTDMAFSGDNTVSADFELSESDYMYVDDTVSLSITGDLTIEAWIKLEQLPSTSASDMAIVAKYNLNSSRRSYLFRVNVSNQLEVFFYSDATNLSRFRTTSAVFTSDDVGVWRHVSVVLDVSAPSATFYKNGISQAVTTVNSSATSIYDTTARFQLGAYQIDDSTNTNFFDGLIDDVRVWSDIRTEAEIGNNMAKVLVGNEAGLVAYWDFEPTESPSPSLSPSASPSASPSSSESASPSSSESRSPSASPSPSSSPSSSESRSPSASQSPSSSPSSSESRSISLSPSSSESRSPSASESRSPSSSQSPSSSPSSSESRSPSASPSPSSSPSSSESASPSSSISSSPSPSIGSSPSSSESASESRSPSASPSPSSSESASESPSPSSSVSASPSPSPSSSESPSPSSSISATPSPSPSSSESRSPSSSQSPSSSESASESSSPSASESPSPSASESASPSSSISASPSPAQYADKYDESVGNTYIDKYKNWYT